MHDYGSITTRAMLARVTIRSWGGRALDRKVTEEVAEQHGVSTEAGRYNKQLVPKARLEGIVKASGAIRQYHYEHTLPWADDGARVLPAAMFETYREGMFARKDVFDAAVADFCAAWPEIMEEAKRELGSLFRPGDYPSDPAALFGVRLGTMPMPDATDFRVSLGDADVSAIKRQIEEDTTAALQAAVADTIGRIRGVVGAMSERLRAYRVNPETGKQEGVFRDSLVGNVRDLVMILPGLNLTADPAIARACEEMRVLCAYEADELRTHPGKRADTLAAADSILASLEGYV